jgi:hypothetical protein
MAHDDQSTQFEELLRLLSEHGFDGMAEAIEILMNEAMKLQQADALGSMPCLQPYCRRRIMPDDENKGAAMSGSIHISNARWHP